MTRSPASLTAGWTIDACAYSPTAGVFVAAPAQVAYGHGDTHDAAVHASADRARSAEAA